MSSRSKTSSPSQSMEPSDNRKTPTGSRLTPIACRVCNEVFFNNVSLILHFESHVRDEVSMARLDLAFLQSGRHSSLNSPPFSSSVEQTGNPHCEPDGTLVDISKTLRHLTRIHRRFTPSASSYPLIYSEAGMRSFGPAGSESVLFPLQFRGKIGGQGQLLAYKNPHLKQLEKPIPEVIVISDDEEDENKSAEIDLTLKL
ncbi:zinc finger protein [Striga asiatica]|uniref:Zinc finger protein n=1 Tax=Striga asiatica TaxID=4170 RepID=A0A5A7QBF6_STRAF|nr:zinc finger protein [Striga asiatica]